MSVAKRTGFLHAPERVSSNSPRKESDTCWQFEEGDNRRRPNGSTGAKQKMLALQAHLKHLKQYRAQPELSQCNTEGKGLVSLGHW